MLKELHIKNVAVIEEVRVEFDRGFNVLTGETGAGKSILIDSINMALGGRCSRDIIRSGCDFALVDLCFEIDKQTEVDALLELGIEAEDGMVFISRRLGGDGKSVCRINGGMVSASTVREAAPLLIDIHGQSDNQSLMSPKNHLMFIDEYGRLSDLKNEYTHQYNKVKTIKREIDELSLDEDEKARRYELLNFQAEEIRLAQLKVGEDEELTELRDRLYNMESIVSGGGEAYAALYGNDTGAAYDLLKIARRAIADVARFDSKLSESYERLENVIAETEDIAAEINSCLSKTDFSMAELDQLEERLEVIANLKRKYGSTIEEIIDFGESAAKQAQKIEKTDEELEKAKAVYMEESARLAAMAETLSQARKEVSQELEKKILAELSELDMPKVRFSIGITERMDDDGTRYSETGKDHAEFLISTNPGESVKPMTKIASGGELSRIMLGIKSVLCESGGIDTMIFDEIDTGVSGRAAQKIAEKIAQLSKNRQVFSITHLPQIAGMADSHYLIEKTVNDQRTQTTVSRLDETARIDELARIIGGVSVTELTRRSAEEMLSLAKSKKESN